MEGVSASDGNGNDITHQIKILKNTVNTDEVGTYEVKMLYKDDPH